MDREALKSEILRLHSEGMGRQAIATTLHTSRPFVRSVINEHGEKAEPKLRFGWLPADDDANLQGSESNYLPTPDDIARECLEIRAKNGHLREDEELSRA